MKEAFRKGRALLGEKGLVMSHIKGRYPAGDIDVVFVNDTAYIASSVKDMPYQYRRVRLHECEHYKTRPFGLVRAPKSTQDKYEYIADRHLMECICLSRVWRSFCAPA